MNKLIISTLLLIISFSSTVFAQAELETSMTDEMSFGTFDNGCNISQGFINEVKNSLIQEYGLEDYAFSNLTQEYCYEYRDSKSTYLTFLFKEESESVEGFSVSASFYENKVFDYDILFSDKEEEVLGYSLKNKYITYYINNTDEEYYVTINSDYQKSNCTTLMNYYNNLIGEKYFNELENYCNIVYKTRTSELKSLISEETSYIYHLGGNITFHFNGYTNGSYDLETLSNTLDCDINTGDYYYPDVDTSCYGIYKKDYRIHFSTHTQINNSYIYLSVYGYENGRAKISVSAYDYLNEDNIESSIQEDLILEFVKNITSKYFNQGYSLSLNKEYDYFNGEARINSLSINHTALNSLNKSTNMMYSYYTGNNMSITYSQPYIQIYLPEELEEAEEVSESMSIIPKPYYNRYFVITNDRIYSEITLRQENETKAVNSLNEFITPYVSVGKWSLNMTVTGSYYPIILYEYGVRSLDAESGSEGLNVMTSSSSQGVVDEFSNNFSEFNELNESESILTKVWNFLKNLFT